jgi:glucosamine--fructose-6-phosphate aminotransferase (isomerizing)
MPCTYGSRGGGCVSPASATFPVPGSLPEELSPILCAIPIQLFAENLARLKGLNPDSPRGLSKVTETW